MLIKSHFLGIAVYMLLERQSHYCVELVLKPYSNLGPDGSTYRKEANLLSKN